MRSLLTQLTESIGDSIAQATNKNELVSEKLHLNSKIKVKGNSGLTIKMSDISMKDLLDAIENEDADLSRLLTEFISNSPSLRKKYAKNHSSSSYRGGCGSGRSGSCGFTRSSWSSSGCGYSRGGC